MPGFLPTACQPSSGLTRRQMLQMSGLGFGSLALSYLLHNEGRLAADTGPRQGGDLRPRPGHFTPQANAVIMLVQNGGPSHMDLFEPKPELTKRAGLVHDTRVEMFQKG